MRLTIVGSGPGGYVAAIRAAQLGAEVTVIEDVEVGGTCLNRGCIPTKTMIASTDLLARTKELDAFGLELRGEVIPNLARIVARKDKVVGTLAKGIRSLLKGWGVALREGRGVLASPREVEITLKDGGRERLESDGIIIATGSRPAEFGAFPFDGENVISSTEALGLTSIPKTMLIVGAGVIGCEFGCIFRELGAEVTIVELLERPVATEDHEISELLERELRKKKIRLLTKTRIEKVERVEGGVRAYLSGGGEISAEKVLVSIGRTLNSDGLGLEDVGVAMGRRGEIVVNERMESSVPGIYAVGDVTGGLLLAHAASAEGIVAARNATGGNAVIDERVVPAAIFTSPEIASVGLREHQAAEKGIEVKTGRFQFRGLGKAHASGELSGFVKVVSAASSDRLLGVHIIGPRASDLIHEAAVAIKAGLSSRDIAGTIHAHPTFSEGLMEAAEDVCGEAIHVPRK